MKKLLFVLAACALAPFAAQATCSGGSACVTPMGQVQPRPVSDGTQDVVVNPTTRVTRQTSMDCARGSGASECIQPMTSDYVIVPFPTATINAAQPSANANVVANWVTTNASSSTLSCNGPGGPVLAMSVVNSGNAVPLVGSNAWASGTYVCTLVAVNSLGRSANATTTFPVLGGFYTPPYGVPPAPAHPTLVCQDSGSWDPVALTWTFHYQQLGRYVGAGFFVDSETFHYVADPVTSTYVLAPYPFMTFTQVPVPLSLYHYCP